MAGVPRGPNRGRAVRPREYSFELHFDRLCPGLRAESIVRCYASRAPFPSEGRPLARVDWTRRQLGEYRSSIRAGPGTKSDFTLRRLAASRIGAALSNTQPVLVDRTT